MLVALLLGSFWIGDTYHLGFVPIFIGWMALTFIATVGWDLRSNFKRLSFTVFFLAWLGIHTLVIVVVVGTTRWFYWLPLLMLELWVGYALAIWLFGSPRNPSAGKH